MTNEIQCDISKSTKVLIKSSTNSVDLNEPLYAINWFSTKVEWLYHFYNFLAGRSLAKNGGKAIFKGKISRVILDEGKVARDLILIVRYPSGQNFKSLMETTSFKIVSIFRMLSVKGFSFGFTQKKLSTTESKPSDNLYYAVHHFKYQNVDDALFSKFNSLLKNGVSITYAGGMVAQLFAQKNAEKIQQIPNLMDGLVLFEAKNETDITTMLTSADYESLIATLESSYIGYLKRTL